MSIQILPLFLNYYYSFRPRVAPTLLYLYTDEQGHDTIFPSQFSFLVHSLARACVYLLLFPVLTLPVWFTSLRVIIRKTQYIIILLYRPLVASLRFCATAVDGTKTGYNVKLLLCTKYYYILLTVTSTS